MNPLKKTKIIPSRINQIIFTFREVTKLTAKVEPKLLTLNFALNIISGFILVPTIYLEKLILDKIVSSIGTPQIQTALWTIVFLVVLRLIAQTISSTLNRITRYLGFRLSRRFDSKLELLMGKKISELDMETIESPEFQDRFKKIESESGRRAWGLMMPLSEIPHFITGFVSSIAVLIFLHPLVALGVFLVSLPQVLVDSKYIKKEYKLTTSLMPLERVGGWLSYYLVRNRSFMELKILGLADYFIKKLERIQNNVNSKRINLYSRRLTADLLGSIPLSILELSVSVWLVFLVLSQKVTIGSFEFYLRALRSAQHNLSGLLSSFLEIYENYIYVSDLVWFLELKGKIETSSSTIKPDNGSFGIRAENVWFKYRKDQNWTLKGVSFDIKPGETVAIVGENGTGKSTLIKLLARFYDPNKGSFTVGGTNLENLDIKSWRSQLGVLFQQFESYPFSARESVAYGDIKRLGSIHDIREATDLSGITDFIQGLPLKFRNPLNPQFKKGVSPSSGQWQRIGISRMLFRKNARLVILDEPTSNVDPEAEEKIFKTLNKISKNKILIFVTQRFSTVRIADKILVMDDGKVIESGSHKDLMKKNGKYAKLFNLQAEAYISKN